MRRGSLAAGAVLFGATGILALATACADVPDREHLSRMLADTYGHLHPAGGPGCVVGVARDGRLLASRADGSANLELGVPLAVDMAFDIGSTAKQFTATSVAILARRGKIDLDADIRTYLPALRLSVPVTVRQLIHHSGGLPDVYEPLERLYGDRDGNRYPSDYALRMAFGTAKTEFTPGSKFAYSNVGYLLLGQIVEKVTGQSLRAFAEENLFRPLGMTQTHFHDNEHELVPRRASSYALGADGKTWEWRHSDFIVMGDGGAYSTLADLARWYAIFSDPGKLEGGRELLDLLLTPGRYTESGPSYHGQPIEYGFGIQLYEWKGQRVISHPGAWAAYGTAPFYFPASNLALITLCNYQSRPVLDATLELGVALGGPR